MKSIGVANTSNSSDETNNLRQCFIFGGQNEMTELSGTQILKFVEL